MGRFKVFRLSNVLKPVLFKLIVFNLLLIKLIVLISLHFIFLFM